MARATQKTAAVKTPDNDYAALTLLDAAFCVSLEERETLVRKALGYDASLRQCAEQWAGSGVDDADYVRRVATDLLSFLESLPETTATKRHGGQVCGAPFDAAWRQRLATIGAQLSANDSLRRDFDDTLATQKIDALKEFAYGAGHEINNPLANISARAQTLLRDETHGERRRMLATINRQAMRAHEMIADLMLFARPPKLEIAEVDVGQTIGRITGELAAHAASQATRLTFSAPPKPLLADLDGGQFGVAIKSLIRNALEAVAAGGNVEVVARGITIDGGNEATGEGNRAGDDSKRVFQRRLPVRQTKTVPEHAKLGPELLEVSVRDDGPGLSPREQAHLFDPFFSGREAGRGLGFGLCLAWRIVTDHGGQVAVVSEPGHGTCVTATFPRRIAATD
jgi:signal transduction histidine kinase